MSVLTDIAAGLWIFFTGAAAARIAFASGAVRVRCLERAPEVLSRIRRRNRARDPLHVQGGRR